MKEPNSHCAWFRVAAIQIWCRSFFAFGCTDFDSEIEHVGTLVYPESLLGGVADTLHRVPPTAPSPSTNFARVETALFQIQQQFVPPLGRFSHPIADHQQLLSALLIDAVQHHHIKFHILAPQATVDAVRPHVQVHILAQRENLFLFKVNAGSK